MLSRSASCGEMPASVCVQASRMRHNRGAGRAGGVGDGGRRLAGPAHSSGGGVRRRPEAAWGPWHCEVSWGYEEGNLALGSHGSWALKFCPVLKAPSL